MFFEIFRFELKQALKRPSTYIFFAIYFTFHLLLTLIATGVIPMSTGDSNAYVNSQIANASIYLVLNQNILMLVGNIIIIALMATAVSRDFEYNTHALFFTKPVSKAGYFLGRYAGSLVVTLLVFTGIMWGHYVGCLFSIGSKQVGPMSFIDFVKPFFMIVVPNVILFGTIYFSLTTFSRNTTLAYLFTILFFLFDLTSGSLFSDIEYETAAAMLDPYGEKALQQITKYWSPDEQNVLPLSLTAELLYNRLLWLGVALLIMVFGFYRFSFSQFLNPVKWFSSRKKKADTETAPNIRHISELPKVTITSGTKTALAQLSYIFRFEFRKIVRSYFFIIILVIGGALAYGLSSFNSLIFGTETLPVTYNIVDQTGSMFRFMLSILIIFYSGNLIFAEKQFKIDELVGASPQKSTTLVIGKYLGLLAAIAVGLLGAIVTGVVIQSMKGYYHFELDQYLISLYGRVFLSLSLLTGLCFIVQMMVSNRYIGFVISFILAILLSFILDRAELTHPLYNFNSSGPMSGYSDMNGYGHTLPIFYLFKLYWLSVVALLFCIAIRFYMRGKERKLKARFRLSRFDGGKRMRLVAIASTIVFLCAGSYIFYNLNILNKYVTNKEQEVKTADFEKKYKYLEKIKQPRIVSSYVEVDLFPKKLGAAIRGHYYLKNKHSVALDTLAVFYTEAVDLKSIDFSNRVASLIDDKSNGVKVFKLGKPLAPGDSIKLSYQIDYFQKGFSTSPKEDVVYNGSFINSGLLPIIGYNEQFELSENSTRKKYSLSPKERMNRITDTSAYANTYISKDADWIWFECVVSTDPDQIAVAPGYLMKEYVKDGRKYFHYKMDAPILNFYSFLSARYQVKKDKYKDINIEVFYHPGHDYNVDRMISSVKSSLDYFEKNFSKYQHRQVRILEFPRYQQFAQSFPNTIPYSESIGFIAKVNDEDPLDIDYPYYITAHEVGHQWWAHQVIGADVQGATLMSESMAEYSALMVMEKRFGKEAMHKFLKYSLNRYLIGRATESKKELPIMLAENQQYIHYNKGCLVMYALRDYIGEDSLNAALRRYIKKVGFQEPPYTTSVEFVRNLRMSTPDSLQYVINDLFEDITLYENYTKDLSYEKTADGKYKVKLTVGSMKFKADSIGKNKPVAVNDWMDIGIFTETEKNGKKSDKELLMRKIKMDQPVKTFEFLVDAEPKWAGLDPYNKLIDRIPENNRCKFGEKPTPPDLNANSGNVSITIN